MSACVWSLASLALQAGPVLILQLHPLSQSRATGATGALSSLVATRALGRVPVDWSACNVSLKSRRDSTLHGPCCAHPLGALRVSEGRLSAWLPEPSRRYALDTVRIQSMTGSQSRWASTSGLLSICKIAEKLAKCL